MTPELKSILAGAAVGFAIIAMLGCTVVFYGSVGQNRRIETPEWTYTSEADAGATAAAEELGTAASGAAQIIGGR